MGVSPRLGLLAALLGLALAPLAAACGDGGGNGPTPPANITRPPGNQNTPPPDASKVYVVVRDEEVILNGTLFGGENEPLVILSHMRPNDQTAWFDFARVLAADGYAALTFDFRGYGDSTGDQDFERLDDDLLAVIDYMVSQQRSQIFLVGASMGATTALVVGGAPAVDAVVALSPPAEFEGQDALQAATGLDVPKLLLASEGDAPALRFDELRAAAMPPVEDEIYPGNAHGTDLLLPDKNEAASRVRDRILRFLDEQRGR